MKRPFELNDNRKGARSGCNSEKVVTVKFTVE